MTSDATRLRRQPSLPGHVCLSFEDPGAFAAEAETFLLSGLRAGERVWYVAPGDRAVLTARLRQVRRLADALDRGAVEVISLTEAYDYDMIVDPPRQVAAYATATERALAAGFAGLCVVADATPLVRTPAQRDAFIRYEYLIDRYMRTHPMRAICAYDRSRLGARAVAELACVHPEHNASDVLFRLSVCCPEERAAATLTGELDPAGHDLLPDALERAGLRQVDGRVVVRATDLTFIDHRSLMHLERYAKRHGTVVVLRTARPAAARLARMLDLTSVRVEVARS